MEVIRSLEEIPRELEGAFVTIVIFDGVPRGHRAIFRRLIEEARPVGRPSWSSPSNRIRKVSSDRPPAVQPDHNP